jgi:hypothetical protein
MKKVFFFTQNPDATTYVEIGDTYEMFEIITLIKTHFKEKLPYYFFITENDGAIIDNKKYFINAIVMSKFQAFSFDRNLYKVMNEKGWDFAATFYDNQVYLPFVKDVDVNLTLN